MHFLHERRDDVVGLQELAPVRRLYHPSIQCRPHSTHRGNVFRVSRIGQILDLVGVRFGVVEHFFRKRFAEFRGRPDQLTRRMHLAHQRFDEETFFFVAVECQKACAGSEVSYIVIPLIADASLPDDGFIDPVPCAEDVATRSA